MCQRAHAVRRRSIDSSVLFPPSISYLLFIYSLTFHLGSPANVGSEVFCIPKPAVTWLNYLSSADAHICSIVNIVRATAIQYIMLSKHTTELNILWGSTRSGGDFTQAELRAAANRILHRRLGLLEPDAEMENTYKNLLIFNVPRVPHVSYMRIAGCVFSYVATETLHTCV